MIIKKHAFTLIEVIIATSILSISVFWVYKLISENNRIINNSNIYLSSNLLVPVVENCIENISPATWTKYFLYLWNDYKQCSLNNNVILNNIDWINYELSFEWNDTPIWKIWAIEIFSDFTWKIESNYIQK